MKNYYKSWDKYPPLSTEDVKKHIDAIRKSGEESVASGDSVDEANQYNYLELINQLLDRVNDLEEIVDKLQDQLLSLQHKQNKLDERTIGSQMLG